MRRIVRRPVSSRFESSGTLRRRGRRYEASGGTPDVTNFKFDWNQSGSKENYEDFQEAFDSWCSSQSYVSGGASITHTKRGEIWKLEFLLEYEGGVITINFDEQGTCLDGSYIGDYSELIKNTRAPRGAYVHSEKMYDWVDDVYNTVTAEAENEYLNGDDHIYDEDEESDEDNDTEEANESYLKRHQLERRTRRMERLMKNEKGLFGLFSKGPAKLNLKTFLRKGELFMMKVINDLYKSHEPDGQVEVESTYMVCSWKNGVSLYFRFNNGKPRWATETSSNSDQHRMERGDLKFVNGNSIEFDDPNAWDDIKRVLDTQSRYKTYKK